ncbi:MAG: DUF937 domain-containing protein [Acidobacteria bacterium]|nr:DUF937 domain-containing protein [Acidobacteriota bacterium]
MGLLDGILGTVGSAMRGGGAPQGASPLDSILSSLAGSHPGLGAGGGGLLGAAMSLMQQGGGLTSVLDAFRQNGMAQHVDSWVGTGPNMPITAQQAQQALGAPAVSSLASRLGLSTGQASSALAQLLPEIVNQLTPGGSIPDNHGDMLSRGLAMLRGQSS